MILRIIAIIFGLAVLAGVIINIIIPPGSHPWPKPYAAASQIEMLRNYANDSKEPFLKMPMIDNASFISTAKLRGASWTASGIWKYNDNGELLDPWGKPYIIGRSDNQITITSPGLDQYNKLSSFQRWWSNE